MSRALLCLICILGLAGTARAEPAGTGPGGDGEAPAGTAYTMDAGRAEVGVFQPLRYGLTDDVELSTHALLNLLMPNAALVKRWPAVGRGRLATRHAIAYPGGLLLALAREGTGGILPHETRVPHILLLRNQVLFSQPLATWHLLTGRLGISLAPHVGQSTLDSIDMPVAFARTAALHRGWSVDAGVDVDGVISGPLRYFADVDVFVLPYADARWAVEHAAMLGYAITPGFTLQAGYKLVYGPYRYGARELDLLPLVDAVWRID